MSIILIINRVLRFIGQPRTQCMEWRDCIYSCCESYPRENVVPQDITDEKLAIAVKFRMKRRFPSVVWRNRECGSVLLRSSQPEVGFLYYRNEEDEALLQVCVYYIYILCQGRIRPIIYSISHGQYY